jgi:hypothetical protein
MRKARAPFWFQAALAALGLAAATAGAAPRPPPDLAAAALYNGQGLTDLAFAPFGRPEHGWAVYGPLVTAEIDAHGPPDTPAFAADLARWQGAHGLSPNGAMDPATFNALKAVWQGRRPFVAASRRACPPPPPDSALAQVPARESYGGKVMRLNPDALAAYGRMAAAARAETPALRSDPRLLTLFSAYRDPDADAARCVREANCQGVTRASCSAHRTGMAVDIYLGAAPGFPPDSSDDINRLAIAEGPAYRWLVAHAGAYGFVPYAFEPWHWEWTGEPAP